MSRCDGCGGEDCACCEVFIEQQYDLTHQIDSDVYSEEFTDGYHYYLEDEEDE